MYKERKVRGMLSDGQDMKMADITLRVTVDRVGKSLSLTSEDDSIMLLIPLEPVQDLVRIKV